MRRKTFIRWLATSGAFAGSGVLSPGAAQAQSASGYPDKPIRILVPYSPGGFNDTLGRLYARRLQDAWGQPVTVENRGGAGTIVGTQAVAKAPADGYTLLVNGFPLLVNPYLYDKLPYDTKELTPVILGGRTPNLLVVRADSPIKSFPDLIAQAKAHPGKLTYASAGAGSSPHLATEYLKVAAGIDVVHVPYKGSAQMNTDLLGGQVSFTFNNVPNTEGMVKAGKLRAIAVTSAQRLAAFPAVPTIAEQGYPGFELSVWFGLFAPAAVPRPIIVKLNEELDKAMKTDAVKAIFAMQGVEPLGGSLEDFQRFWKAEEAKWVPVIKSANIRAD
jgi:tripartite-type tricarboxylate transporter receptor subunit TctC